MKDKYIILIIDDEKIICETYKMQLHLKEYEIVIRNDAKKGLEYLENNQPDLILLDVMMPEMDGFEACRIIKNNQKWKHIPIILITALEGKNNLIRGLESGADEFLSKPVNGPELRARVRSMLRIKSQYDELEENMEIKEHLSHMIMHDIRTPLLSIAMISETSIAGLQNGMTKDQIGENFNSIMKEAKNLNSFINDMLLLTKIESGKLKLNLQKVEIEELILQSVQNHKMLADKRNINIDFNMLGKNGQTCRVDYNLFLRVIDNVLSNAIKFSHNSSNIYIEVEDESIDEAKRMVLKVIDEGVGVNDESKKKIFTKYETGASVRKGELQTGIGLAFCKMVVEAHNGRIYVEDNQPKGAKFTIEI